jgi:protein phosphatase
VADGMGGHNAGEVASRLAVETVLDYVAHHSVTTTWPYGYDGSLSEHGNLLRTAVLAANKRVFEVSTTSPACAGMGTTIVAALVRSDVLTIAHVGDSRLYALNNGRAQQLTSDDSWAAAVLARDPSIDPEVLKMHPMRNALTSVIGSRPQVDVHVAERHLENDELLLLTTDGVHGVLGEESLADECRRTTDLRDLAASLVRAALATGSRDNCTAVVARFEAD